MNSQAIRKSIKVWCEAVDLDYKYTSFNTFVESLKRPENTSLIESVQTGINVIQNETYNRRLDKFAEMLEAVGVIYEQTEQEIKRQAEIDASNKPTNWKMNDPENLVARNIQVMGDDGIERTVSTREKQGTDDVRYGYRSEDKMDEGKLTDEQKAKRRGNRLIEQELASLYKKFEYGVRKHSLGKGLSPNNQEDAVGELMAWAVRQAPKFDPSKGQKLGTFLNWEQQLGKVLGKFAGTVRGDWKPGQRPESGYIRIHDRYFKLIDDSIKQGDKRLNVIPTRDVNEQGVGEVWEEVDSTEYNYVRGKLKTTDLDGGVGGDSGQGGKDMTVGETVGDPSTAVGVQDDIKDVRKMFTRLSDDLNDDLFNKWDRDNDKERAEVDGNLFVDKYAPDFDKQVAKAKSAQAQAKVDAKQAKSEGRTPNPIPKIMQSTKQILSASDMAVLKTLFANPNLMANLPELLVKSREENPGVDIASIKNKAGEELIKVSNLERSLGKLAKYFAHDDWDEYAGLKEIMSSMQSTVTNKSMDRI